MFRIEQHARNILGGTKLILVDVGAAHGLPAHLRPLEAISQVCYFEPHAPAAEALRERNRALAYANSRVFTEALADSDGERTLYVTNVPTGSSLLKPGSPFIADMEDHDYFFPMREVTVQTRKLSGVLRGADVPRVDGMKIDVQGAEYFVLKGMGQELLENALSIEMEIGFPGCYQDQPGFAQLDPMMRNAGFTLFDLRIASAHRKHRGQPGHYLQHVFKVKPFTASLTKRICEADAVYIKRSDLLIEKADPAAIRRAMTLQCAYGFFIEALHLNDVALSAHVFDSATHAALEKSVIAWHGSTRDLLLDWRPLAWALNRGTRAWQIVQQKFFGRWFGRWAS
jgi:FkbM family methyltransferase